MSTLTRRDPRRRHFAILRADRARHVDPATLDAFFRQTDANIAIELEYADVA